MDWEFGFVSICLSEKGCSPAGSVTAKQLAGLDSAAQRYRILSVARRNLEATLRIMWFLRAHRVRLYRLSAQLIPLATHPVVEGWAWWEEPALLELGEKVGRAARENGYRLSSHFPEVCGFTSEKGFFWTRAYFQYHRRLFGLLGDLDGRAKVVVHLGGQGRGGARAALAAARANIEALDGWARERLVLENDGRAFGAEEVLEVAEPLGIPVAFDWHHHWCRHGGAPPLDGLESLLARCFALWRDRPPKVHVSSPRGTSGGQLWAHADYVDPAFVEPFFRAAARAGLAVSRWPTVDVMVEAKQKDLAMFRLREAIAPPPTGDPG